MLQSTEPEKISSKEGSRGMHESHCEGDIVGRQGEYLEGGVEMGTGGSGRGVKGDNTWRDNWNQGKGGWWHLQDELETQCDENFKESMRETLAKNFSNGRCEHELSTSCNQTRTQDPEAG